MSLTNFGTCYPPYNLHTNLISNFSFSKLHSSYTRPWANSRKHFSSLLNNLCTTSSSRSTTNWVYYFVWQHFFLNFAFIHKTPFIHEAHTLHCQQLLAVTVLHFTKIWESKRWKRKPKDNCTWDQLVNATKASFQAIQKGYSEIQPTNCLFAAPEVKVDTNEMESCGTRFYSFSN